MAGSRESVPLPNVPRGTRQPIHRRLLPRAGAVLVAALLVLYGGMAFLLNGERLRPRFEAALSAATGRRVEMQSLEFSFRHLALIAGDLSIAEDPSFGTHVPFLQARSVSFDVRLLPLMFEREVEIQGITLDSPVIVFKQEADGVWNYYSVVRASRRNTADFDPPSLRITGGRLGISGADDAHSIRFWELELAAPALGLQSATTFTAQARVDSGGTVKLEGKVGPVEWPGASPLIPISGLLHVTGLNLAQLNLMATSPGVAGLLSLDGAIESDGRTVRVDGQATARKLKLASSGAPSPDKLEAVFTLHHDLDTHSGVLDRCDFRVSKGAVGLTGKYTTGGQSLLLNLAASVSAAPATDLAPYLPALGFPLPESAGLVGGMVVANLSLEGPLEGLLANGSVSVTNTRLTGFDLSRRLAGIEGLDAADLNGDFEILSWKAQVKSRDTGLGLDGLETAIAGLGVLSGSGTIRSDGRLDFRMSGIRGLTGPKGTPIPFTIRGTCTDPVFRPGARP